MHSQILPFTRLFFGLRKESNSFGHEDQGAVCVENIGPQERRRRLRFGIVTFIVGVAIATVLILTGVNRWWRIGLFFPFYLAAIGFFQAYEKT